MSTSTNAHFTFYVQFACIFNFYVIDVGLLWFLKPKPKLRFFPKTDWNQNRSFLALDEFYVWTTGKI